MTSLDDSQPPAKTESPARSWRHFLIPGTLALVGYVILFQIDSRARMARGPWEVTFQQETSGTPAVVISQASLGLSNIVVRFADETLTATNLPVTVRFLEPQLQVPFGVTAFDDLMYLPGTIVLHCFGHEVQMLPRALYLNRKEVTWQSETRYTLEPSDKLPNLDPPKKTSRLAKPN